MVIICPEHGEFSQAPVTHLTGGGCSDCGRERVASANAEKYEALYRQRVQDLHDGNIEVSGFYLRKRQGKKKRHIRAICRKHSEFIDLDCGNFFKSRFGGCKKCRYEYLTELMTWTTGKFIEESQKLHGKKYSYDKVDYKTARIDVYITCPKHGTFTQPPMTHLRPSGCRLCADEELKGILKKNTHPADKPYGIYLVRLTHANGESFIKVGLTINDVKTRLNHLANYTYTAIDFVRTYYLDAWEAEDAMKNYFTLKGLKHWPKFELTKDGKPYGRTECAIDTPAVVEYAKQKLAALVKLD